MIFQRGAVTERFLADVADECFDSSVLHQMSFQVVRRRKPSTAVRTVKLQVQLESEVGREMFATLVTPAHRTISAACHASCHWRSMHARMPMCRRCLVNKPAFVRNSYPTCC